MGSKHILDLSMFYLLFILLVGLGEGAREAGVLAAHSRLPPPRPSNWGRHRIRIRIRNVHCLEKFTILS